jgi:hypothetical protein
MKNLTTLSLITATILGLNGCGGGGSSSTQNTTDTKSKITLRVSDAASGFLKEDVTLKFSGVAVSDENGNPITQLSLLKDTPNKIALYIKTPPTETKNLRIVADSDQYLATGASLLVRPTARDYAIELKMAEEKIGKVTEGVYLNELDISSMVDTTGKVTQEIVLESNPGADISTKIKIPVNTILLDKDGNPILNATLKVTSFDPRSQKALQAYPGGLNVMADATGFKGTGTANQEVNFKTAGFVAIEIAGDNNKRVKTFSQDVEVAMQFKVGTTDGDGHVVQAGDAIPIWSYSEETGEWTYEEEGTAVLNLNDNTLLDVVYNIRHLSYYNLDWHYGNVCSANINVIDSNNVNALNSVDHFTVSIPGANLFRTVNPWGSSSNGNLVLYNVPAGYQGTVTAYDANGLVLGNVGPTDLCGGQVGTGGWTNGNYDNEVDLTIDDNTTDVNVSMTFSCPNNVNVPGFNSSTVPFSAVLTNLGGTSTQLTNGTGTLSVSSNGSTTYDVTATSAQSNLFAVIDAGNSQNPANNQITLNSSNTNVSQDFVLTNAFCNPLSGQINGVNGAANCGLTNSVNTGPRVWDVAQSSNGDVYISHTTGGIMKSVGGTAPFVTLIAQSNSVATMPVANPTSAQDEPSEVTVKAPRGLDIIKPTGSNIELLVYTDKTGHCVNMIDLTNNVVATIAGVCGVLGDTASTANTPLISTLANLKKPTDIAYDVNHNVLFIADEESKKIKMVEGTSTNIWTVAGDGNAPTSNINYTPDNALTTAIKPLMLDVDSNGQVVFSSGLKNRVVRLEGINFGASNPGATAELRQIAGNLGVAGASGDGAVSTNALLHNPIDIEIDGSDNILIANRYNHKIRRIDAITGIIDTVAGTGSYANPTQCGQATAQNIRAPYGLWIQDNGDFFFTQTPSNNNGANNFSSLRHVTY